MAAPYDPESITYFAEADSRNQRLRFGIKSRDRTRHMYVIGKSGVGKSTLLENMAIQDIKNGEGLAVLDPHGSFAEKMLEYIPESRIKDVVYFAPFDTENPISFNVLEDVGADRRHLVVSGLMSTFKKIWVDAWSARMEYILTNTLLALLEYPGATLLGVNRMLSDKVFRKKVVENITDSAVKAFWTEEFANYTERMAAEAVPAIQNKIGQFTGNPLVRNIIGQSKSTFDIRKIMDEQKILIINLSKGRIGDTNTSLLGSMIITKIYLAAMSRAELSASRMGALPNFYFYVDEFQSFANETFADILAEARKYKLALIIAHQYVAQMEEKVRDAVFGNVGTTISFRVGPLDAELLEKVFSPQFTQNDLVNLGMAQIYLTLMINDIGSQPFSARTLPPPGKPDIVFRNSAIEWSRKHYANPKEKVEESISEWFGKDSNSSDTPQNNKQNKDSNFKLLYKNLNQKDTIIKKPFMGVLNKIENKPNLNNNKNILIKEEKKVIEKENEPSAKLVHLLDSLDKVNFIKKNIPFTDEKSLRENVMPLKHEERGPKEKNMNLLKSALQKAMTENNVIKKETETIKIKEIPKTDVLYSKSKEDLVIEKDDILIHPREIPHDELKKILE